MPSIWTCRPEWLIAAHETGRAESRMVAVTNARGDVVPADAGLLAPPQDRHAGQLGPIVGNDAHGPAAADDDGVELARDPQLKDSNGRLSPE